MSLEHSRRLDRLNELRAASDLIADDASLRRTYARLLAEIVHDAHNSGTGSTTWLDGCPACTGFAVAYPAPKFIVPHLSTADIEAFIFEHYRLLHAENLAVGTWKDPADGSEMVLATQVTADRKSAVAAAAARRQRAVHHLGEGDFRP